MFHLLSLLVKSDDATSHRQSQSGVTIANMWLEQLSYLADAEYMDYRGLARKVANWLEDLSHDQALVILEVRVVCHHYGLNAGFHTSTKHRQ